MPRRSRVIRPAPHERPDSKYTVRNGDTLSKISARPEIYGDAGAWRRLYEANRDRIRDPARLKPGQSTALDQAIERGTLGRGSVAEGEYLRNMADARTDECGRVRWVEVCYCPTPLAEEREYWEEYFELEKVQDAHARSRCRDLNGSEPWACGDCDCSARLEARLATRGAPFVPTLKT